jgi:hypothetical protein
MWYMCLLQHRAASYFRAQLPRPEARVLRSKARPRASRVPKPSHVLDVMQSWLSPVIGLVIWGLLQAGVYSRGWYVAMLHGLSSLWALRSFFSIVNQRLATLKHIASIVSAAQRATPEQEHRRHGYLRMKAISLAVDLVCVFVGGVIMPSSLVFLGSTFNSYQYAVHGLIFTESATLLIGMSSLHLHSKFASKRRERATPAQGGGEKYTAAPTGHETNQVMSSVATGLSAIGSSEM